MNIYYANIWNDTGCHLFYTKKTGLASFKQVTRPPLTVKSYEHKYTFVTTNNQ